MPAQRIIDKKINFTEPELILSYFIDNQLISGVDAIILMKAIIENQKKEPEPTLFPRGEKEPISSPSINTQEHPRSPTITNPMPYNPLTDPMRVYYNDNINSSPSNRQIFDGVSCITTAYDANNVTSITTDKVKFDHPTSSTEDNFFIPSELSI